MRATLTALLLLATICGQTWAGEYRIDVPAAAVSPLEWGSGDAVSFAAGLPGFDPASCQLVQAFLVLRVDLGDEGQGVRRQLQVAEVGPGGIILPGDASGPIECLLPHSGSEQEVRICITDALQRAFQAGSLADLRIAVGKLTSGSVAPATIIALDPGIGAWARVEASILEP